MVVNGATEIIESSSFVNFFSKSFLIVKTIAKFFYTADFFICAGTFNRVEL
jgi:hypothetical protein